MLAAPPFNILSNLDCVDSAIDANAEIASALVASGLEAFGLDGFLDWKDAATPSDMDKARSTIRQMYRDWSAEGAPERSACYGPVLRAIDLAFAKIGDRSKVRVLVPGAGLGRLVFEICQRGYTVEGNEISYHQLIASNWVLNHTQNSGQYDLYPFALDFSNVVSRRHQLKGVKIPDVHPASAQPGANDTTCTDAPDRMSMTAADFIELYSCKEYQGVFDAVATVYFVDTAPNVIRYIETVRNCLKDGGTWVNLGPLLWHFAERGPSARDAHEHHNHVRDKHVSEVVGIEEPGSVELSNEELLMLLEKMGFEIAMHEIRDDGSGYIENPESMLGHVYRTSHWVARKKRIL